MAIVVKPITVEVSKPNVFQAIAAKQNDCNSRFLQVTFANEGEKITVPSSAKVTINAERNDGKSNSFFGAVNDDGTVTVPIHSWILELPGYVDCDVSIIEDDSKLTCTTFSLLVEEASHNSDDISEDEQYDILGELINDVKSLYPPYAKEEIDPVFANNSWELIKAVCQHDDPSKYWKVGDYKMVKLPKGKKATITNSLYATYGTCGDVSEARVDAEQFLKAVGPTAKSGIYSFNEGVGFASCSFPVGVDNPYDMMNESMSHFGISLWCSELYETEDGDVDVRYTPHHCSTEPDHHVTLEVVIEEDYAEYPLQIIGFNHDKVTDPYNYGKQKAGMTLQLGASRNVYGDTKPGLYEGTIDGLMAADGKHYKSPNKVLTDFSDGATNWAEGGFRIALQSLFDGSEIAPYLAEVQKYTSQYYNNTNKYYSPMLSNDKVFLPSEYEIFGLVSKSPGPEGEHYEFYKDGYSKFMWSDELLNGAVTGARVWLRSAAAEYVSKDTPNSIYGTSIYLGVYSLDPISLSYMPSGVASGESVAAYIAPCICL